MSDNYPIIGFRMKIVGAANPRRFLDYKFQAMPPECRIKAGSVLVLSPDALLRHPEVKILQRDEL